MLEWLLAIFVGLPLLAMFYLAVGMAYVVFRDVWRDERDQK